MSSNRRFGRFQSTTATESHQRQLAAPVHKWKREWVAPTGMAPESSYKVFKWVRTDVKAQFTGGASEAGDDTPAPDGNGDEEDEEEAGDEDDDEGEGKGEGEGEEGEDEGEGEGAAEGKVKVEGGDKETTKPEDAAKAAEEIAPGEAAAEEPVAVATPAHAPAAQSPAPPASAEDTAVDAADAAPATALAPAAPSPAPATPAEIPSNAVGATNVGPEATEMGAGEAGHAGAVELQGGKEEDGDVVMESSKEDVEMSVDEPAETDEGLVMGEMEPPVPELTVEGADAPAETEKA